MYDLLHVKQVWVALNLIICRQRVYHWKLFHLSVVVIHLHNVAYPINDIIRVYQ